MMKLRLNERKFLHKDKELGQCRVGKEAVVD